MLYNSTGNLPIYNFDKIVRNNDYRYLVIGWNERDDIELPKEVDNVWQEIYNEYCVKTENNEALTYYALHNEVSYLETRLEIIIALIENMTEDNKEEFGRELNAWGVKFNIKGSIASQIPNLKTALRGAKQKYDIRLEKLNGMKSDDEPMSILRQIIKLDRITGIKINIKTDVVDYLIEVNKEAAEITQAQKNG